MGAAAGNRGQQIGGRVRPDHALATRERGGLDDTGQPDRLGQTDKLVLAGARRGENKSGLGHLGRPEAGPHRGLVASQCHRGRVVGAKPEPRGAVGRGEAPLVVDGDYGIERARGIDGHDRFGGRLRVLEAHLDGAPFPAEHG